MIIGLLGMLFAIVAFFAFIGYITDDTHDYKALLLVSSVLAGTGYMLDGYGFNVVWGYLMSWPWVG